MIAGNKVSVAYSDDDVDASSDKFKCYRRLGKAAAFAKKFCEKGLGYRRLSEVGPFWYSFLINLRYISVADNEEMVS